MASSPTPSGPPGSWATSTPTPTCAPPVTPPSERLERWIVDLPFDPDVAAAVTAFAATDEAAALTGEHARLLTFTQRDIRLAGHELDEDARAELRGGDGPPRRDRRSLQPEHRRGRRRADRHRRRARRLAGGLSRGSRPHRRRPLPGDDGLPRRDPVHGERARRRDRREELSRLFNNRAVDSNRALLAEAVRLRERVAELFGEPSWAHHTMGEKMANDPKEVDAFYAELVPQLTRKAQAEIDRMAALLADRHRRRRRVAALGLALLRHRAAAHRVRRRHARGVRLLPAGAGARRLAGDHLRGVRCALRAARRPTPVARRRAQLRHRRRRVGRAHRRGPHGPAPARGEVQPRRRLRPRARPAPAGRLIPHAGVVHRRQRHQADRRPPVAADPRRGAHALPRVRPHPPPDADACRDGALRRYQHRARLRRGAVADHGALVLAARGARPLRPPSPHRRGDPRPARPPTRRRPRPQRRRRQAAPDPVRRARHGPSRPSPRRRGRRRRRARPRRHPAARRGGLRLPAPGRDVLPGQLRPPARRLRRRVLRLPVVGGVRRRHVQPLRRRGRHQPGGRRRVPPRDPGEGRLGRRQRDARTLPRPRPQQRGLPRQARHHSSPRS